MHENMAMFAATLLHSGTNAHFFHWTTDSYSKHKALGNYYEGINDLIDSVVEVYMGCYGKIEQFPSAYHQPKDPLVYMESLKRFVAEARTQLPQETPIQNLIDGIAELIDTTVYKLKFLK